MPAPKKRELEIPSDWECRHMALGLLKDRRFERFVERLCRDIERERLCHIGNGRAKQALTVLRGALLLLEEYEARSFWQLIA